MRLLRSEFEGIRRARAEERARSEERSYRQIAQAAITAEVATKSAEWNFLLELIQAEIERLDGEVASFQASLGDPQIVAAEDLIRLKLQLTEARAQRDALRKVQALPKAIFEAGKKATLALDSIANY